MQAGGRRFDPDQLHQLLVEGGDGSGAQAQAMQTGRMWPEGAVPGHITRYVPWCADAAESVFRAGIFVSGKERKLAATGVYLDIHDRDASAARHSRKQKDQAETGL